MQSLYLNRLRKLREMILEQKWPARFYRNLKLPRFSTAHISLARRKDTRPVKFLSSFDVAFL